MSALSETTKQGQQKTTGKLQQKTVEEVKEKTKEMQQETAEEAKERTQEKVEEKTKEELQQKTAEELEEKTIEEVKEKTIEEVKEKTKEELQQKTTEEVQQELAESSGRQTEIIWDLLTAEQSQILKNKIKNLIRDQEKGQKSIIKIREILFERIWEQRKYTNRQSLTAIIYVLVVKQTTPDDAKKATSFSCHPVFRTRKCINEDDSSNCCMIFIDETGRVYQNWEAYLSNNVLPKGTMIAPARGVYTFDDNDEVQLEICDTPATKITNVVLDATDTGMTVTGIAAAAVPIAALAIPVAAPVILGAAAVGLTTAAYTTVRSGTNLFDRSKHNQSISLANQQACNNWLGVFGGLVGLGASKTTQALAKYATTGRGVSTMVEYVVNGMNISSIVLSGAGMANGILDLILKSQNDEDITAMDVLQLSASLILFTHSVHNFQLASNIINNARDAHNNSYRKELTKRQRHVFNKMFIERLRIGRSRGGPMDIIRSINEIPSEEDLDDLFSKKIDNNSIHRINLSYITGVPTNIINGLELINATISYGNVIVELCEFGQIMFDHIINVNSFGDLITSLMDNYGELVLRFFLYQLEEFINNKLDEIERILNVYISAENILFQMIQFCLEDIKLITLDYLEEHCEEVLEKVKQHFLSMNPNSDKTPTECKICKGQFVIVDI